MKLTKKHIDTVVLLEAAWRGSSKERMRAYIQERVDAEAERTCRYYVRVLHEGSPFSVPSSICRNDWRVVS